MEKLKKEGVGETTFFPLPTVNDCVWPTFEGPIEICFPGIIR